MERRQQGSEIVYNKGMGHTKDNKALIDEDGDGKQMEKVEKRGKRFSVACPRCLLPAAHAWQIYQI